jgi:SpoVK/Ycf46/Vps4 family AAA+-type ATPase
VKRIYVPLPDVAARRALILHQLRKHYTHSQVKDEKASSSQRPKSNKTNLDPHTTTSSGNASDVNNNSSSSGGRGGRIFSNITSLILGDSKVAGMDEGTPVPGFSEGDLMSIVMMTEGYSGSDLTAVSLLEIVYM